MGLWLIKCLVVLISIMGYVTDTDSNNMYEITFSSDDPIFANTDSSFLFFELL